MIDMEKLKRAVQPLKLKPEGVTYLAEVLEKHGATFFVTRYCGTRAFAGRDEGPFAIQGTGREYLDVMKTYKGWSGENPTLAYIHAETMELRILDRHVPWGDKEAALELKRAKLVMMSEGKIPSNQAERDALMAEINPPPPPPPWKFDPDKALDGGPTNGRMAENGEKIVSQVFDWGQNEPETALQDALSNILHWCDRDGIDFDDALESARRMHAEER